MLFMQIMINDFNCNFIVHVRLKGLSVKPQVKGCGMGPWLVLVSPCFKENVVVTCKIGSFFV